jgi:hypothetical protein
MLIFAIFIHPKITSLILNTIGWGKPPLRLFIGTLVGCILGLIILAVALVVWEIGIECEPHPLFDDILGIDENVLFCKARFWSLLASPLLAQIISIVVLLLISLAWIITTTTLMLIIRILQFVVFRIATYEKGPVLAVSVVFGGIGALLKAFA